MSATITQTASAVQDSLASLSLSGDAGQAEASAEVTAHTPELAKAERTIQGPLKKTGALDGYKQRGTFGVEYLSFFSYILSKADDARHVQRRRR